MKKFLTLLIVSSFAVVGAMGAAEAGSKRKYHSKPAVTSSATGLTVVGAAAANGEAIGGGLIVGKSTSTANQGGQSGYAGTGGSVEGTASSTQTGCGCGGGHASKRGSHSSPSESSNISFGGTGYTEAGVN